MPAVGSLGPYELHGLLGAGGMGEVYRARDLRLGRDVALKILPAAVRHDPARLERFAREARAAAALHHPNVVVVLDAGVVEGVPYIATELLAGHTLREEIARGSPLPPARALSIGAQLARGLAAAHAHGIVHRDLKPENVIVTDDGPVKIIDFGLARITEPEPPVPGGATLSATLPGAVLGTAGYMAPEQVRGSHADHRADVFALGAVLFELLTGRRAFEGPTPADTLAAILSTPVKAEDLAGLPAPVTRLVLRCLDKDAAARFQSAADLAFVLEQSSLLTPEAGPETIADPRPRRWRGLALAGLVVAALGLIGTAVVRMPDAGPRVTRYTQLTHRPLFFPPFPSEYPLLTDGPRLYFTEWTNGQLTVGQVASAGGDHVTMPLAIGRHHLVDAISPDGAEALIGTPVEGRTEEQFYAVPLVAGAPRRLPDVVGHGTTWMPDGRILFARGSELFIAGPDGSRAHRLLRVPGRAYWLRFSPDGARLRFTMFTASRFSSLWETRADGSGLHQVLDDPAEPAHECCGEWTPDGRYYVYQATRANASQLWAVRERSLDLRQARPVQLTSGPVQFRRAVPSRDGTRLFAIGWHLKGELSRYDRARSAVVPHLPGLSAEWTTYSRDGAWMAYITYPEEELWRARSDGTLRQRLTPATMRALTPAWSPDGAQLAFTGAEGDTPAAVFVVPADGGAPRRLVAGRHPSWAPDGRWLAYEQGGAIHTVEVESGRARPLPGDGPLVSPGWSPNGRHLVAADPGGGRLRLFDVTSERWSTLETPTWSERPAWSRDGSYIYFLGYRGLPVLGAVWRLRVSDGHVEPVADLLGLPLVWGAAGFWFGLTPGDEPLLLRDLSRHDLYALDWTP